MEDFFNFEWWWWWWWFTVWLDSTDGVEKKFIVGDGIGKIDEEDEDICSSCLDDDDELDVEDADVVRFFLAVVGRLDVEEELELIYSLTWERYSWLSFRCCWALSCNSFSTNWSCSKKLIFY